MIREANLNDINSINKLGLLVNENYPKLFNLDEILKSSYSKIYVIEIDNNIVGFIHIEVHFEVIDIIDIVIDKNNRKQGLASLLIKYVIDNHEFDRILLEVNSNNYPAIKLYEKFNFKQINIRKKYYQDGDALIMEMTNI
jgi:ribosomal-protein-alanine N-acetyltransferase